MSTEAAGKRVSWVELYFDLIFVFAVGQLSHLMVADPHWGGLGRALGLFIPLWWTWIGFAVLYNRHGEDRTSQRLLVLAGTLPCAVAAIETHAAAGGHGLAFTFALAGARLILALAFAFTAGTARRVAIGYGLYAGGHLAPAFSLLTMAAGISLVLSGEAPTAAAWFITGGLASYLLGLRVVGVDAGLRFGPLRRAAVVAVTVCLAFFEPLISATGVVMVTAAWAVALAVYVTLRIPDRLKDVTADPLSYFRGAPAA
jgi:low temperature requirement protein LtrA